MAEDLVNGWKVQRGVTLLDNERDGIRATVERRIKLDDKGNILDMHYRVCFSNGTLEAEEWLDAEGDCTQNWEDNGYNQWEDDANEAFENVLDEFDDGNADECDSIAKDALIALENAVEEYFLCEHCKRWIKRETYADGTDNKYVVYNEKYPPETWCEECAGKDISAILPISERQYKEEALIAERKAALSAGKKSFISKVDGSYWLYRPRKRTWQQVSSETYFLNDGEI